VEFEWVYFPEQNKEYVGIPVCRQAGVQGKRIKKSIKLYANGKLAHG
jgi:hypothetical protein